MRATCSPASRDMPLLRPIEACRHSPTPLLVQVPNARTVPERERVATSGIHAEKPGVVRFRGQLNSRRYKNS